MVLSSRRGPDALADKVAELGRGASAASVEEAASLEYVLLAVPWRDVESALKRLLSGAIRAPIAATYPLTAFREAVAHVQRGGKVLFDVDGAI